MTPDLRLSVTNLALKQVLDIKKQNPFNRLKGVEPKETDFLTRSFQRIAFLCNTSNLIYYVHFRKHTKDRLLFVSNV